jgi:hypothetical protein
VKYLVNDVELAYIHWDNPMIWSPDTELKDVVDFRVTGEDVAPPCKIGDGIGGWSFPSHGKPTHELFMFGVSGSGIGGITWWDVVVNWPVLVLFTVVGAGMDINLEFKVGLRTKGSVGQTMSCLDDGQKGLRFLATTAGQSSARKLFNF